MNRFIFPIFEYFGMILCGLIYIFNEKIYNFQCQNNSSDKGRISPWFYYSDYSDKNRHWIYILGFFYVEPLVVTIIIQCIWTTLGHYISGRNGGEGGLD